MQSIRSVPGAVFSGTDAVNSAVGTASGALSLRPRPVRDDMVQLLTPEGKLVENSRFSPYIKALGEEDLKKMYRDMVLARRMDLEGTRLQRQGQLALWVPLTGQEAAQVGSGNAAQEQDYIFPSYREHAVGISRGLDIRQVFRVFNGTSNSGWVPGEKNFHSYTMVLAAQALHAVGYAMGIQRDAVAAAGEAAGKAEAVIVYCGDGATSEGDVHEAMVFASSNQSPVVFFVQNNQWAISVPVEVQSRFPLADRAQGYGLPGVQVDGNDVLASYAVTCWALERARRGEGPAVIEAYTFRMNAHTTADDPTKYRSAEEERGWADRDPIARLEKYLGRELRDADGFFSRTGREAEEYAASIRDYVAQLTPPHPTTMFDDVYKDRHPLVDEERAWFKGYEAGFENSVGQE